MARPLRLEFAGALYHVTARGNERRSIFLGDADGDRAAFLRILEQTCERFNWMVVLQKWMLSQLKTVKSDLYKCSYPHPEHYPTGSVTPTV
jgi:REP element-mobilizing transposase RayT